MAEIIVAGARPLTQGPPPVEVDILARLWSEVVAALGAATARTQSKAAENPKRVPFSLD